MRNKKRKEQEEKTEETTSTSKPKQNRSMVPVTLLQNGYVNGKLHRKGEQVEVSLSMHKRLITTSPEVYQ